VQAPGRDSLPNNFKLLDAAGVSGAQFASKQHAEVIGMRVSSMPTVGNCKNDLSSCSFKFVEHLSDATLASDQACGFVDVDLLAAVSFAVAESVFNVLTTARSFQKSCD